MLIVSNSELNYSAHVQIFLLAEKFKYYVNYFFYIFCPNISP